MSSRGVWSSWLAAVLVACLPMVAACDRGEGEVEAEHAEHGDEHDHAEHGDEHDHGEHEAEELGQDEHGGEHAHDEHGEHEEGVVHLSPTRFEGLNISIVPVHKGTVDSTLAFPAEVELDPDNEVHVVPRVRGIVREVFVGIGDRVEPNQLLAVLDSRELAAAKSDYLAAIATRSLAQTTLERERKLWEDKISAEQDYLQAKAGYQAADIAVQTAEQQLHALGLTQEEVDRLPQVKDTTLTHYEIRAPIAATVVQRHISIGETAGEEDEVFFIATLDPVWVMGRATERDLRRLRPGQEAVVDLDAFPGEEFHGTVDYIGSVLDPDSRTADVRVVLPNPDARLRAGLFGQMLVFVAEHEHDEAFLVPNDALQRTAGGAILYKYVAEGEFRATPVNVLHASDAFSEVQGDLEEGDTVASGDVFVLKSEAGKESMGEGHSH